MDFYRPRESILSLFDPLNSPPETPTRDSHSPDSSSDKENDEPPVQPGQLTAFFNRVYTNPKLVRRPTDNLVEVGDTSSCFSIDIDTDDAPAEDGENVCFYSPSGRARIAQPGAPVLTRRRPLADIEIERMAPPSIQNLPTMEEEPTSESPSTEEQQSTSSGGPFSYSVSAAPLGTPLADVINSINLGALNLNADSISPTPTSEDASSDVVCPDITVIPPASEPSSPCTTTMADASSAFLSPNAPLPVFSPPVRRHASTSPTDPRRVSVDLHATFSLQMQSPDMSFDLLNDKVSFLAQQSSDSFWGGIDEEDTMDMAKEEMRMKIIAEKYEPIKEEEEIEEVPQEKLRTPPKVDQQVQNVAPHETPLRAPVFSPPSRAFIQVASKSTLPHALGVDDKTSLIVPFVAPKPVLKKVAHAISPISVPTSVKTFRAPDRIMSPSDAATRPAIPRTSVECAPSRSASHADFEIWDRDETEAEDTLPPIPSQNATSKAKTLLRGIDVQRPTTGPSIAPASSRTSGARTSAKGPSAPSSQGPLARSLRSAASRMSLSSAFAAPPSVPVPSGTAIAPKAQMQRPATATRPPASRVSASSNASSRLSSTLGLATRQATVARINTAAVEPRSGLPRLTSKLPTLTRSSGIKPSIAALRK